MMARPVYDAVADRHPGAAVIIPPAGGGGADETTSTQRNQHIATISQHGAMIGRRLRTRTLPNQRAEANVGCNVLNGMTGLGMPFLAQCLAITPVNSTVGAAPKLSTDSA
jgi:hypothetical protein